MTGKTGKRPPLILLNLKFELLGPEFSITVEDESVLTPGLGCIKKEFYVYLPER